MTKAADLMHGAFSGTDRQFSGVSTDTRTLQAGELFFAIQGPNFDGGRFCTNAAKRNAAGVVVSGDCSAVLPNIAVNDTRLALGRLAAAWRKQVPATVIGVTGSNGKTSLKEMIAACLAQSASTLATRGNLNNDIGMPLTLLSLNEAHRYAVIEMGANHPGEIGYLAEIVRSDIVVITNAAPAHLEGFSSLEGVARAKGEILQTEVRPGIAVLNADDPFFAYWQSLTQDTDVISFAVDNDATVSAAGITTGEGGSRFTLQLPDYEIPIDLSLPGAHNVLHACAAAAVAHGLHISAQDIKRGLESLEPVPGRLRPLPGVAGSVLYDDSYNANPASVSAAIEFLAEKKGERYLVFGDMRELGSDSRDLHAAVGHAAKNAGIDHLLATGELSQHSVDAFGDGADWFATAESLIEALDGVLTQDSNILVKGSRSMRMERIVGALREPTAGRREV